MAGPRQQQHRRVQFRDAVAANADALLHTVVCELPNREDFTPEDYAALWFSKAEYHTSRSEAKLISRDATRYGFSQNLNDTFGEKSNHSQEFLQLWCTTGDCRRGLERWANHEHGDLRNKEQFQAVQVVLEAQDLMFMAQHSASSHTGATTTTTTTMDHEKLRKVSHKATRTARHFARMMGKADSYAVAHELETADTVKNKGDNEEGSTHTLATDNTTCCFSAASQQQHHNEKMMIMSDSGSIGGCDASVHSYSTAGTAISNPRIPVINHGTDLKESSNHQQQRPRFRRFGFGAKQQHSNKRDKEENSAAAAAARVSRIA